MQASQDGNVHLVELFANAKANLEMVNEVRTLETVYIYYNCTVATE